MQKICQMVKMVKKTNLQLPSEEESPNPNFSFFGPNF